jgi:hypothetical protein
MSGFDPSRVAGILSAEARLSLIDAEYDERSAAFVPPFCRGTSRELALQLLLTDTGIWWKLSPYGVAVRDCLIAARDSDEGRTLSA